MIGSNQATRSKKASTMCDSTAFVCACSAVASGDYCNRCDLLVGIGGVHVTAVGEAADRRGQRLLQVSVESTSALTGCPACGAVSASHGRRSVTLVDSPCFGTPVRLLWRKRTWRCPTDLCGISFTEQNGEIAFARALLTRRACWWAIGQIRREHASVQGLARQLGCSWRTVWRSVEPLLVAMAGDESRFNGVTTLGVDEHLWHHVSTRPIGEGGRGPKELTGMVDLTRDDNGKVHARLLDLVPGRSGKAYADWLTERNAQFRAQIKIATLDPFRGYKNAIDDQLEDAIAVLDAFHVFKLGSQALDEVRRRVQQEVLGRRGHSGDPLHGIRNVLRCGREKLTDKQKARLEKAILADERYDEVHVAWQCAQQLRDAFAHKNLVHGRVIAEKILTSFPTCPIPEIARLGRTLRQWKDAFLAYFTTARSSNGGTESVNGLIELHRRIARGFRNRDNYRLRMLLIAGGLTSPHLR